MEGNKKRTALARTSGGAIPEALASRLPEWIYAVKGEAAGGRKAALDRVNPLRPDPGKTFRAGSGRALAHIIQNHQTLVMPDPRLREGRRMPGRAAIRAQIRDPDPAAKIQRAEGQISTARLLTHQISGVWVPDLRPACAGHPSGMTSYCFIGESYPYAPPGQRTSACARGRSSSGPSMRRTRAATSSALRGLPRRRPTRAVA